MITFGIAGELEMFQTTARELAKAELRPKYRDAEDAGRAPPELAERYRELGLAAVELPEPYGGLGQGLVARVVVDEELAYGDLGITLAMPAPGPFGAAVLALGTEEQRAALLSPLIERGQRGAIGWSEPKPKPGTFSTVADEQPDGSWHLRGVKSEVVLGDEAGAIVVFARASFRDGTVRPAAFAVPLDPAMRSDPKAGVRFGPRIEGLGLLAAPPCEVAFEQVSVPASARLSGADDHFADAVMEMFARIGVVGAARAVGVARAAFETARAYAAERQAFGKAIAHFQGLAFLLADMATRVEVMRTTVHRAAWAIDQGERERTKLAAMAIAECHEGAMYVTNNAVQVLGGAGFIQDFPVEKWMRDAKAHMAYAMPRQLCDLMVGRLALDGGAHLLEEDAPMPEIQSVLV